MRLLSEPRLTPYLTAASGNVKAALALYRWNIELSGAVYEVLHRFEVVLRNAMDRELCRWNATQGGPAANHHADWLLDPAPLLRRLIGGDIAKARRFAGQATSARPNPSPLHADILAQLTLGTWRYLLPDADPGRRLLWEAQLHRAFPHRTDDVPRLVSDVEAIYRLRNRVAHLEPLLNVPSVQSRLRSMFRILGFIDPAAQSWVTSEQRATAILRARPLGQGDTRP